MENNVLTYILSALDKSVKEAKEAGHETILFPVDDAEVLVKSYKKEQMIKVCYHTEFGLNYSVMPLNELESFIRYKSSLKIISLNYL